jgi:hypothetical protein
MRWLCVAILAVGCAKWSRQDVAMQAAFFAVGTLDWYQSQQFATNCAELNPIMGPCGDRVPVGIYFPVTFAVHGAIAAALPERWRTAFQAFTIGMESSMIVMNEQTLD